MAKDEPENCSTCKYYKKYGNTKTGWCYRYPACTLKQELDFCGEWSVK